MTLILLVRFCKGELGRSRSPSTIVAKNVNFITKNGTKCLPDSFGTGQNSEWGILSYFFLLTEVFVGYLAKFHPDYLRETSTLLCAAQSVIVAEPR